MNRARRRETIAVTFARWAISWMVASSVLVLTVSAEAAITVEFREPLPATPPPIVGRAPTVRVYVTSSFEVASVIASVGSASGPLAAVPFQPGDWTGTIDISAVPRGSAMLTVSVTDVFAATGSASIQVFHSNEPKVQLLAPLEGTLARPSVHVSTTCEDDDVPTCAGFQTVVSNSHQGGSVLATGTGAIDLDVSLAGYDGHEVSLWVTTTDSDGQRGSATALVVAEMSPAISPVYTVTGKIVGFDSRRIVHVHDAQTFLHDRQSGQDTLIEPVVARSAALSESGVVTYIVEPFPLPSVRQFPIHEWRNGVVTTLGGANSDQSLVVSGSFAAYPYIFRNGDTGMTWGMGGSSHNGTPAYDVLAGGVGFFEENQNLYRITFAINKLERLYSDGFREVSRTQDYDAGSSGITLGALPMYDGTNLAYIARHIPLSYGCFDAITLRTPTATEGLIPESLARQPPDCMEPRTRYALAGGWAAYSVKNPSNGIYQIWLRAPDGSRKNVLPSQELGLIDSLAENGEAMLAAGGITHHNIPYRMWFPRNGARRFFSTFNSAPIEVGSATGFSRRLQDGWYIAMGRTLFRYPAGPGTDGGSTPDSGTGAGDAGTDSRSDVSIDPGDGGTIADGGGAEDVSVEGGQSDTADGGFIDDGGALVDGPDVDAAAPPLADGSGADVSVPPLADAPPIDVSTPMSDASRPETSTASDARDDRGTMPNDASGRPLDSGDPADGSDADADCACRMAFGASTTSTPFGALPLLVAAFALRRSGRRRSGPCT